MDNFLNHRVRNFYTFMKTRFVFQILYRNAQLYLTALRSIDRQSDKLEAQLENATKNEHLIDMMELEKSIVYLKASLKMNERIVKKLTGNASSLKKYIEDEDLLEDTLVETQQAIEMAGIYENVLNAMAETSASIIGNNQNTIMKTLALMTMALDIPTVIFSAYGMNFKNNSMPLNDLDNAFWVIFFIAAFGSSCVVIYFIRKKWFKNRLHNATYAYMVNMLVMGFWHGLSVSYIVYGFYHGVLMAGFEVYQKKSNFYKKNKNKKWYKLLSWFVTMNLVMVGFFIFSGEPYKILLTILKR